MVPKCLRVPSAPSRLVHNPQSTIYVKNVKKKRKWKKNEKNMMNDGDAKKTNLFWLEFYKLSVSSGSKAAAYP